MSMVNFNYKSSVSVFLLASCSALFSPLHAQYDDLLRKSRYTWVAEYTCDYELNPFYGGENNHVHVIRLGNPEGWNGLIPEFEIPYYLSEALLKGIASGKFTCFRDSALTQRLPYSEVDSLLVRKDTVIVSCDGDDYEESYKIIKTEISPNEINLFRVRQVFFYDSLQRTFGSRLLAVAPVVNITDPEGNFLGRQPLLWIGMHPKDFAKTQKIARNSTYAVQTFMTGNAPQLENMETVKGELYLPVWASSEVFNPSHKNLSIGSLLEISSDSLISQIDTKSVRIFIDPETGQRTTRWIYDDYLSVTDKVRFVQNWYYDDRKHSLAAEIVAVAPMAAVRDSEGNLMYYKPLFYSKY